MPTFSTPEPIEATIELVVGDIRVTARDSKDTVVEVRPSDSSHEPDVRAAEQTRVDYSAGHLLVKAPRQRGLGLFGRTGSVDVTVELPTGSRLEAKAAVAAFRSAGRLGECRIKTSTGDIQLGDTGSLDAGTGAGDVVAGRVLGDADVRTGSGKIRVRAIDGTAVIKNSNGDNWIGDVTGDSRVNTANGDISVDCAHRGITCATANGDIRIGEIVRGTASFDTAFGQIEMGIRAGTAARLDVRTSFGKVDNHLDTADSPGSSNETIDVRAHTSHGDIVIRRS
ncbi:DUF4097 family beta strand repeat-containing protein [Rhodococcus tibetensis]|uniref:DUF4097 family beta strand repeat-containing protein n=1 Tax=Rhodococcus tibetensis TaxID=2965064 RepID=A0ABT1QL54_9NOCA|nr:DUF4097 family beta strand repeat-containing protein [Rhodococcus sp. FXJ9.536]MCQ4121810.1 DUF4097 family beta strand repeat-containing protein [Rhodococcus sp. FXJ9.536]